MKVELLWWEGCPSWPQARDDLERILGEEGVGLDAVELTQVRSDKEAASQRFPGSPTIRIDGRDVIPPGEGEPVSLTCRVYRLRDGRPSPTPDPEDLRASVRRAKREEA